jgi:hypothetical protein
MKQYVTYQGQRYQIVLAPCLTSADQWSAVGRATTEGGQACIFYTSPLPDLAGVVLAGLLWLNAGIGKGLGAVWGVLQLVPQEA